MKRHCKFGLSLRALVARGRETAAHTDTRENGWGNGKISLLVHYIPAKHHCCRRRASVAVAAALPPHRSSPSLELIRVDAEVRLSPELRLAFLHVRTDDKLACLLHLLRDVVDPDTAGLTIVFTPTRHHCELLQVGECDGVGVFARGARKRENESEQSEIIAPMVPPARTENIESTHPRHGAAAGRTARARARRAARERHARP